MYNVSSAYKSAAAGAIQEHKLTGTIGNINFTEANIVSGTFSIQNQCSSGAGSDIQPGSVIIGELSAVFTGINLTRGQWRNKVITPTFSLKVGNTWEAVPLGVFKVKEAKHTANGVEVKAYDNMHKFDKSFKKKRFKYSGTMYQFLSDMCTRCHVTLGMLQSEVELLTNGTQSRKIYGLYKDEAANDIKTFRDFLSYIAQATCTFATINRAGALVLRPFGGGTAVDTISDSMRLSGAVFEDYETKYNGIFVNDMDTGDEVYYGYDADDCADMLTNLTAELQDNVTAHNNLENEHDAGKISDSDYAQQKLVLDKEATRIQYRIDEVNAWNTYRTQHPEVAEGSSLILGDNPLLQSDNITYRDHDRTEILAAAMALNYTPFTASLVCGAHYDLGDIIEFTNGHAGTSTMCCVMGWTYNLNAENTLEGYGADPDISNVHSLARKKASVAIKDYNDTKVEVHNNYNETNGLEIGTVSVNGDPKSLYQQRDQTHLEKLNDGSIVVRDERLAKGEDGKWSTKLFWIWAQNDLIVDYQHTWYIADNCIKCDHPFLVVDFPDGIGGMAPRIADINGNSYYESYIYLVTKVPRGTDGPVWKELDTFHSGNSERSNELPHSFYYPYTPWGEWTEFSGRGVVRTVGDYDYYAVSSTRGATYSGLYGMCRPDKHYPSSDAFWAALNAGEINPPDTKKGDIILPTGTTQKETSDAIQELANTISGDTGSGTDPSTEMQVEPDSTTDVESENTAKNVVGAINQIKNGISSWIGNIVNKGRGNVVATVEKRDGTEATNILASTNLITSGDTKPILAQENDLHCQIEDASGIDISMTNYTEYFSIWNPRLDVTGYSLSARSRLQTGVAEHEGRAVMYVQGLTVGKSYTFSYDVCAFYRDDTAQQISAAEYWTWEATGQRLGKFGMLFTDTMDYDESTIPDVGSTSAWDATLRYQTLPNIGITYTSFSNTFTATAVNMYVVVYLDSLIKLEDKDVYFNIKEFKTQDMNVKFSKLFVQGADGHWFEFDKGEGTVNYEVLENKPQVNGVTLIGNKTTRDLGMIQEITQAAYDLLPSADKLNPDKVYYIKDAGGSGGGGGGGSSTLAGLTDVDLTSPTNGQVLEYDSENQVWKNADASGGGGTTVVANPSGAATDTLNKLQVGSTIYGVSGGDSYSQTVIYTNSGTSVSNIELTDDYTNYDSLYFECIRTADNRSYIVPYYLLTEGITNIGHFQFFGYNEYCSYDVTDSTHFTKVNNQGNWYIKKIYGVKH